MTGEDAKRMWPGLEVGGGPAMGVWICPKDLVTWPEPEQVQHLGEQEATGFEPFRLCVRGKAVYEWDIRATYYEDVRELSRQSMRRCRGGRRGGRGSVAARKWQAIAFETGLSKGTLEDEEGDGASGA